MDLVTLAEKLRLSLAKDSLRKYILKVWVYKDSCCVIDFDIDGKIFAFDIKNKQKGFSIELVSRKNNDTNKEVSEIENDDIDLLLAEIKNEAKKIEISVLKSYQFQISVIIPVYNRAHLIERCVKSLNTQTLDRSKFEVIFVDDFSKDNSISFIENTIDKDINYKILKRPINSGSASAPRNDGMMAAKGRYFLFIDSDDFIFDYCLQDLLDCAERNNPDVVYLKIDGDKGRPFGRKPFQYGNIDNASIADNHLTRSLMPSKMVKKSIIFANGIHFPVDIKVGEDRVFIIHALSKAKKISVLADKPYYYLTNHFDDRLSYAPQGLDRDFEIISRTFRHINMSNKNHNDKKAFLSIWMNSVIESYLISRVRNKKHPVSSRKEYISMMVKEFDLYKEIHSDNHIYSELKVAYEVFSRGDTQEIYEFCNEFK